MGSLRGILRSDICLRVTRFMDMVNFNRHLARDAQLGISPVSPLRYLRLPPMLSDGGERPTAARNIRRVIIPSKQFLIYIHGAGISIAKTAPTSSEIHAERFMYTL